MTGHGKHCNCMVCSMGKALCMISKRNGQNCNHPSHQKDKEDTKNSLGDKEE